MVNIDDLPVTPGVDGSKIKNFEDLIDKSIKQPSSILIEISNSQTKWPYLKKGSGLLRFQAQSPKVSTNEEKQIKPKLNQETKPKTLVVIKECEKDQVSSQSDCSEKENESISDTSSISLSQLKLSKKCRKVTFPETSNQIKKTDSVTCMVI